MYIGEYWFGEADKMVDTIPDDLMKKEIKIDEKKLPITRTIKKKLNKRKKPIISNDTIALRKRFLDFVANTNIESPKRIKINNDDDSDSDSD